MGECAWSCKCSPSFKQGRGAYYRIGNGEQQLNVGGKGPDIGRRDFGGRGRNPPGGDKVQDGLQGMQNELGWIKGFAAAAAARRTKGYV